MFIIKYTKGGKNIMTVKELMKLLEERMNEDFGKTSIGYMRDGKFYALCGFKGGKY